MRAGIGSGLFLIIAGVVSAIAQLWFAPWSPETFLKIEMTVGGMFLIVVAVFYAVREYREDKVTRSGDRLDG